MQFGIVGLLGVLIGLAVADVGVAVVWRWVGCCWASMAISGRRKALVAPLAAPLTLLLILYVRGYNNFSLSRGGSGGSHLFGQYVPREIVEEMSRRGEHYSLEGESRQMTVLFSDIAGFTTALRTVRTSPVDSVDAVLTPLTRIIHEHRGTIDKYIGDAIMAFWGAPLADSGACPARGGGGAGDGAGLRALDDDFSPGLARHCEPAPSTTG